MKQLERWIRWLDKQQWKQQLKLPDWQMKQLYYVRPGVYEVKNASKKKPFEVPGADQQVAGEASAAWDSAPWQQVDVGRLDGGHGTTYLLKKSVEIPEDWQAGEVALLYHGGGEGLLRLNGAPYHGVDANHWFVSLPAQYAGGDKVELELELFDPIPEPYDPLNQQAKRKPPLLGISLTLVQVNRPVYSLLHTVRAVIEAVALLPEGHLEQIRLKQALEAAALLVYNPEEFGVAEVSACLTAEQQLLHAAHEAQKIVGSTGYMHLVGQSHIDIAWLWPIRETVRKVSRTFSTVCALMDRYPDFRYSQSQPILYAFVKEHYPDLFERIKQRVAEGRWELVGGMWVEPDLNIPSGESLVRQMLVGQRFYEEEFGIRSSIEWLPDTFGYCASLPQLLKQAGVNYFMTTKLGWNDTNLFPYTLFNWVGIDGTSIVSYQNHGVNEHTRPQELQDHWEAFGEKDRHEELMLLYGHGDGGGGVTHEMLEYADRSARLPGLPKAKYSTAQQFFDGVDAIQADLPKWQGDLYLELHRGTYTTHAKNKRSNRQAEQLYRAAELWLSLAGKQAGEAGLAARADLRKGWKLLLLNQFHDIIPGTSIPEVYETSTADYKEIMALGERALETGLRTLSHQMQADGEGIAYVIFNSLGWERNNDVLIPLEKEGLSLPLYAFDEQGELISQVEQVLDPEQGECLSIQAGSIPAFGSKIIWLRQEPSKKNSLAGDNTVSDKHERTIVAVATPRQTIETDYYVLELDDQGLIHRLYDKKCGRELLQEGQCGNELQLFEDTPVLWDAWDIAPDYESKRAGKQSLTEWRLLQQDEKQTVLELQYELGQSTIRQHMVIPKHKRILTFHTHVTWREDHKLLKVAFPLALVSDKATYEIPFGALERTTRRNTSWEQAQYEVCGHRWADVSEHGYGVSLLNDCKYGYDVKDGIIRLSLLRAPSWPDVAADRGDHVFTYALYPHEGSWQEAHTLRHAAELNEPLRIMRSESVVPSVSEKPEAINSSLALGAQYSWLHLDSAHVVLDTVKPAEDGNGIIMRLYESAGGRSEARITLSKRLLTTARGWQAAQTNLLEDWQGDLHLSKGSLELTFKPYEIKTIRFIPDNKNQS